MAAHTMQALVKDREEPGLSMVSVPVPEIGPQDALVKVEYSSICGTDLHIYNWDPWAQETVPLPNIVGHEFAGTVVAVGSEVLRVRAGDKVSAEGHIACRHCRFCRTGNAHVCPETKSLGITRPGIFAEYAAIPESNLIVNPSHLPGEVLCLQDPLGNAVQTVLSGRIAGKSVAVLGAGPIGIMAVAVAKACGAGKIIAADLNEYRLGLAKSFGADSLIRPGSAPLSEQILSLTEGEGAEVVLELTGNPGVIAEGCRAAAPAGRVSLLGLPAGEVPLRLSRDVIFKGLTVHGITGRKMYETWYQLQGFLSSGRLDLAPLVTHRFKLNEFEEAFGLVRSGQCGKVVFVHE